MKALVTGAGGFIGSRLVERLVESGASVRAFVRYTSSGTHGFLDVSPVRDRVEVVAGDIVEPERVRAACAGMDVVFHLAASIGIPRSFEAPREFVRTNIEGTLNVLEAVREHGVRRMVHTSTSEVYGTPQAVPISEGHPLRAQSPYAASKIAADKLVESFHRSFGVAAITVRPFNTYGPRQSLRAVIPSIIAQTLTQPVIKVGALAPLRDLTFVDDTVDGFLAAAGAPDEAVGSVVQLGTGRAVSIAELVEMITRIAGKSLPVVEERARLRPAHSEVERLLSDPARAKALLGWTPRITLEDGLARTVAWFREAPERVAGAGMFRV